MSKKIKKTGYVILDFFSEDKEKMKKYFNKIIDEKYYFYAEVNNKKKGGLVLDKMHITLFYGLDNDRSEKNILNKIKIKNIELGELELFFIKEFKCNALVLKVNDKSGELEKIHNCLSKLNTMEEKINHFKFNPHITIAYVKKDFKIKKKNIFLKEKIKIKKVDYKT